MKNLPAPMKPTYSRPKGREGWIPAVPPFFVIKSITSWTEYPFFS